MVNLITTVFKGQDLALVPTIGSSVELYYIEHFSVNKCKKFEGTVRTLSSVMVLSNKLKGFPSVPIWGGCFFEKKLDF